MHQHNNLNVIKILDFLKHKRKKEMAYFATCHEPFSREGVATLFEPLKTQIKGNGDE